MDRPSRRISIRRPTHATSTPPPSSSGDQSLARHSPVSPEVKPQTWHLASQNHSQNSPQQHRRISRTSSNQDISMSTPEHRRDSLSRRKSKAADDLVDTLAENVAPAGDAATTPTGADADDGPTKGGHSLRRRVRVNYASEHVEDEVTVPNSTLSASRQRRRRRDSNLADEPDDFYATHLTRQGTSSSMDTPSGRRRNPSRKSTETRSYFGDLDDDGDIIRPHRGEEIHDTIQVDNWSSNTSVSPENSDDGDDPATQLEGASSPRQEVASPTYAGDAHLADTGHEANKKGDNKAGDHGDAQPPTTVTTTNPTQDSQNEHPGDPSQQLHAEFIGSSHHPDGRDAPALAAPADSSMSRRSPDGGSSAPHDPANQDQAVTNNTHSPEIVQNGDHKIIITDSGVNNPSTHEDEAGHAHPPPSMPASSDTKSPAAADISSSILPSRESPREDQEAREVHAQFHTGRPSRSPESRQKKDDDFSVRVDTGTVQDSPSADGMSTNGLKDDNTNTLANPQSSHSSPPTENGASRTPPPEPQDLSKMIETPKIGNEPVTGTPLKDELAASDVAKPDPDPRWCRPQPVPAGRWSHLTPYVDGQYSVYPEKKVRSDEEDASEDQSPEDKDSVKDVNEADGPAEDTEDRDPAPTELPTLVLNTPTRGSPAPEAAEITALNSPAPVVDEPEDADVSESQEPAERKKYYRYRKLRDADDFAAAVEKYEEMSTEELYDVLDAINLSLVGWQEEWTELGKIVDDYENATRRRIADAKYETRTRNLHQHGVNYEEPDFAVRGYRAAKEREVMSETRYLQSQDRLMASVYGFEYDPHPSKIGKQNPETQQAGVTTRGRSLRNQPRQTVKATEADGVSGKRQRKPVQLFDPAPQDVSRANSPVPTGRGRRRRTANVDNEDAQVSFTSSLNDMSDGEGGAGGRRKRAGRSTRMSRAGGDDYTPSSSQLNAPDETPRSSGRRGRGAKMHKTEEWSPPNATDSASKQHKRHLLTLKIPKQRKLSEPSSGITDNGDSRPSTASSDSTTETIESSYSFRPKRQKRFRDEPEEIEAGVAQPPPKKRNRRVGPSADGDTIMKTAGAATPDSSAQKNGNARKTPKIKLMRPAAGATTESRNGTPMSQPAGDEQPKEYRAMTKSEKMSASMKNRWANGNMAGAVEKRKATLAAKKAAQAGNEQRVGPIAPKPKAKPGKKASTPLPGENPAFIHAQPPPPPPHHHAPHMPLHPHVQPHPVHNHPHPHPHQHSHPHPHHPHHEYPNMGYRS